MIKTVIFDRHLRTLKEFKETGNSIVSGFPKLLYAFMSNTTQSVIDTGNVARSQARDSGTFFAAAPAADVNYGIIAGTGTAAVTINDYNLQSKIMEGTSAGQMNYSAVTSTAPVVAGSTCSFKFLRTLTNNSSGSITINEVGIVVKYYGTSYNVLMDRSIVTPKLVTNTNGTTIQYTFSITV
ncbi:MAG: hypothetical protein Q8940_07170 [Bacteroidota bacterium]|nr:hypothetical protein [Bacteroidota bacterium]